MKFRGRIGASFVFLLTLAATVGLFHYAFQFRKASLLTLQNKLQTLELQRFEEDKGGQATTAAQKAAERFNLFLAQIQKRAERLADSAPLRQSNARSAQRKQKENIFLQYLHKDSSWIQGVLTSEDGTRIAATNNEGITTLAGTQEFQEVLRQRMTLLRLVERKGQDPWVQVTVPCLSNTGMFLGVVQLSMALTPAVLDSIWTQTGVVSLLGTSSGRRLTATSLANFPNHLSALMNKDPKEMEIFLAQGGSRYFRAEWANKHYLVAGVEVRLPGTWVYTLLEVGGLEKLLGTGADVASEPFWKDPVMIGGLGLILFLGLVLTIWLSGSGSTPRANEAQRLAQDLEDRLETGSPELLHEEEYTGTERNLAAVMNRWLNQNNTRPSESTISDAESQRRWTQEANDLRQQRERLLTERQALQERVEDLSQQNQQLRETARQPAAPAPTTDASSQLRIDAIVNMSDDLKATLTVIRNYISSILSSEEGKITDAQQEFLGVVINKSARLERQINDLLDLSHLETEAHQMFTVPTDMNAMLQDVILNSQAQADSKQIHIAASIPNNLSKLDVNGDRLGQVFIHLVQQALRVTPVGGEVRIEVEETNSNETIKILDGATPLAPTQAAEMFSRFHGLDSQAGPMLAGAGLRFAIVSKIIEAHHGHIQVQGLGDQGNEIRVELPKSVSGQPSVPKVDFTGGTDTPPPEAEATFDLSTFMQGRPEPTPQVAGGAEDLDELLKNIENINGQLDT